MEHEVEVLVELGESGLFTAQASCGACGFSTRKISPIENSAFTPVKQKADRHSTTGVANVVTPAEIKQREEIAIRLLDSQKQKLIHDLETDPWTVLKGNKSSYLKYLSAIDVDQIIVEFITSWCKENLNGFLPDAEQARVIASIGHHTIVSARAGSGKTSTMVARTAFLVKACNVDPSTIMVLAFNRDAADELRSRISKAIDGPSPHVLTFHSLAYRLVRPRENLIFDSGKEELGQSQAIQEAANRFTHNPKTQPRVQQVMLTYFRNDWDGQNDFLSAQEQIRYRKSLQHESLGGDYIKSYGEKVIANTLLTYGILRHEDVPVDSLSYGYEHDVSRGRANYEHDVGPGRANYKPDFSIYGKDRKRILVVEYFGMKGQPDYDQQAQWKRNYWRSTPGVNFLEYEPKDVTDHGFEERFIQDLKTLGLHLTRLSDEEIWTLIKGRAIDSFARAVAPLINRAKQRRWDGDALKGEWERVGDVRHPSLREWIHVSADVLDEYQASLASRVQDDFTGLLWRAIDRVDDGKTEFGSSGTIDGDLKLIRYFMIDEFQDFSLMFHSLISGALTSAPHAEVMAVGDDWQAINEFAGSTTHYFQGFSEYFKDAKRLDLVSNRRSSPPIVDLGNEIMRDRGLRAHPSELESKTGLIRSFNIEEFTASADELIEFPNDLESAAIVRLICEHRNAGRDVAVLFRTKSHKAFKKERRIRFLLGTEIPKDGSRSQLHFSTTHAFKGDEATAVIIADAVERKYPLIHPTWMLYTVFGDSLYSLTEAERRLFYVAASRPVTHLDVITSISNPSEFWEPATRLEIVSRGRWKDVAEPEFSHIRTATVQVKNSLAPSIDERNRSRDFLNKQGFRWNSDGEWWWISEISNEKANSLVRVLELKFPYIQVRTKLGKIQ